MPESCFSIWKWFIDLDSGRTSNGFGIDPLSYSDMLAYFQLINIEPTEEEIDIIKKLDQIALNHNIEQMKKRNKATSKSKK